MRIWLEMSIFAMALLLQPLSHAADKGGNQAGEPYDEDTYGPQAPTVWVKPVKSVIFEHRVHTMDAGLDCGSCHDDLFEMSSGAAAEKDDFTMAAIYKGKYCGSCHDGSTVYNANTRCTTCHIGVRGHQRLERAQAEKGRAK